MDGTTILAQALKAHGAGDLDEARELYLEILRQDPNDSDACNLLGTICRQQGKFEEATRLTRRALEVRPVSALYLFNLAECHRAGGMLEEAAATYRRSIAIRELGAGVWNGLAQALLQLGRQTEAIEALEHVIGADPRRTLAYEQLAACLCAVARYADAEAVCNRGLEVDPECAPLHARAGALFGIRREWGRAAAAFARAVELNPRWAPAYAALARALNCNGQPREAGAAAEKALRLNVRCPDAHLQLGVAMEKQCALFAAASALSVAVEVRPEDSDAWAALAGVRLQQLRRDEAYGCFIRAAETAPRDPAIHGKMLLALNYGLCSEAQLIQRHLEWYSKAAAAVVTPDPLVPHVSGAGRPLRVGYVSADLRDHPVAVFMEPILQLHNRDRIAPVVFSDTPRPDATTTRLRETGCEWYDTATLSDAVLAHFVRDQRIDILVDLAGHTARNRLMAFLYKPAPLQITYLGYPNTTGLPHECMHYRLTDALCDPPGDADKLYSERLYRLPAPFLCYRPPVDCPPVSPPPFERNGAVTFGCFNGMVKITPEIIRLWSDILAEVNDRAQMRATFNCFLYEQLG